MKSFIIILTILIVAYILTEYQPERPPDIIGDSAVVDSEEISLGRYKAPRALGKVKATNHSTITTNAQKALPPPVSEDDKVLWAARHYQDEGFTPHAISALLGTIKQESNFTPDGACGDGGIACGIYQWWPTRRSDMPADFRGQIEFSIREMKRDSPGTYDILKSSNDVYAVRSAIQSWIRWGHEGERWVYADQFYQQLFA